MEQDSFWSKVEVRSESECWLWKLSTTRDGYGQTTANGRWYLTHRLAYEYAKGDAGAQHVMHTCDVKACCNPRHLVAGTRSDNMRDMVRKGRCKRSGETTSPKLKAWQVKEIRRSSEQVMSLARLYHVSPKTIRDVKTRTRYAWVS